LKDFSVTSREGTTTVTSQNTEAGEG